MSEPAMGVAIVSYNTAPLLRRCLESVLADSAGPILVIDNSSPDDSAELVRREFPSVRLRVEDNRGYGAAANHAIDELDTRYVLLLNADTQLRPGTMKGLAAYLDQHPATAVAGPRLVSGDGIYQPSAHRFPTPIRLLLQESSVHRLLPRGRGTEWRPRSVDWVLGAALAVRREAFEAVGGFDNAYFLYQEEVDLCYRLQAAGWEIHYAPVATIVHLGGASTSQRAVETFGQFVRSTRRFARLRLSRPSAVGVRAVLTAVLWARLAREAVQLGLARDHRQRERIRERIGAWRHGLAVLRERPS